MRAYGRRGVLALAGLLAVAACSGTQGGSPTHVAATSSVPITPTPSPTQPSVTPGEAAKVFAEYTATDDLLRAGGDLRLALDLVSGAQAQLTLAAYQATEYQPPRYTWGPPTLLVPRLPPGSGAPWFSVLAKRGDNQAILTFAKTPEWRLSSMSLLEPEAATPEVEIDASGYAVPLLPDDKSVLISPRFMSSLHATVAEAGPTGITGGLIAPGPYTTEIAAKIAAEREQAKGTDAFDYDSIFTAGDYPIYALRTKDGGALLQYSLTRTTTITNKAAEKGAGIPIPANVQGLLPKGKKGSPMLTTPRVLKIFETHQYAATIPKANSPGEATVVAHESATTRVTAT